MSRQDSRIKTSAFDIATMRKMYQNLPYRTYNALI